MITNKISNIREMCEMVNDFRKHHVLFVPIPVTTDQEFLEEILRMNQKLVEMAKNEGNDCTRDVR